MLNIWESIGELYSFIKQYILWGKNPKRNYQKEDLIWKPLLLLTWIWERVEEDKCEYELRIRVNERIKVVLGVVGLL